MKTRTLNDDTWLIAEQIRNIGSRLIALAEEDLVSVETLKQATSDLDAQAMSLRRIVSQRTSKA